MDKRDLKKLLTDLKMGEISVDEAITSLSHMPLINIGCASLDSHRFLRNGFNEVIYGEGKSVEQIKNIVAVLGSKKMNIFGTRTDRSKAALLKDEFQGLSYNETSRTFKLISKAPEPIPGIISICCAGTADIPVAEEAFETASFFGLEAERHYDVGVAGLHRLIERVEDLKKSDVLIVIAGMEGALPSVVGGIFHQPIIAVPTSIGYGTNFSGITPLLSMLNSCAEGITVVNIDNGFGATCAAIRILNTYTNKKSDH